MNSEKVFYLLPYLLSLLLSSGIFVYAWQRRNIKSVGIYVWFVSGQTLSILTFILELASPNLETKLIWDKIQWITQAVYIVAYVAFAIQFTGTRLSHPRIFWAGMIIPPLLISILAATDGVHHLIYPDPRLNTAQPFAELEYTFTILIYIYSLYIYSSTFYGIGLLLRRALERKNPNRIQFGITALGFLIPVALSILSLFDIKITPQRDSTPLTFATGNLIVAIGLFRYHIFNIIPIAREWVMENMTDPVFVLDVQNNIVDFNIEALALMGGKTGDNSIVPSSEVFGRWNGIMELVEDPHKGRMEISLIKQGEEYFYDFSISPIVNNGKMIGHIIVAHDITRQKVLENSYRILSEELDQRVKERTKKLHETAEQYRAVVEHQTEFIVRWKPDGTRTFVNEAYCRYFNTTVNQALSKKFLPLIVEEDRRAVEEKIQHLVSGSVNVETDVHRVIKPDGEIGWQEWTEQVIRDQTGQVIEIQSVGRDITARKLAEESLLNQVNFDEVMTRILARFATSPYDEVDANIELGLQEIAEFMQVDYADIFLLSENKTTWKITHQWGNRLLHKNSRAPVIPSGKLSWSETKLSKGELIKISTLEDYPLEAEEDRQFSEKEGARSLISIPIRGRGQLVFGCLDLISYTNQIDWSESDVTHLKILGDVIANTLERKNAESDLVVAYDTTLEGWAKTLELKDKETEGHSRRVTEKTLALAEAIGIPNEDMEHIHRGAILHDIGKLAVPDRILKKEGPLTKEEREVISKHPETAYNLLKQIPYLKRALEIPYCHHEKWDGSGYPRGLAGEEIPLAARIFAVVDVWDALSSDRPYRKAWEKERVVQYIIDESGKHFDPYVVNIFLTLVEKGRI